MQPRRSRELQGFRVPVFERNRWGIPLQMSRSNGDGSNGAAHRYEQAATETLEMLDWCIGYFEGVHKGKIASRLATGRRYIKENFMNQTEVPLPTSKNGKAAASEGKSRPTDNENGDSAQPERYKRATTEALELLDWSIGYMVGSRKHDIASQLAQNRKHIREDLMREPAEPVPTTAE